MPSAVAALVHEHPDLEDLACDFVAALQHTEAVIQATSGDLYKRPSWLPSAENVFVGALEPPYNVHAQIWTGASSVPSEIPRERLVRLSDLGVSPLFSGMFCLHIMVFNRTEARLERGQRELAELALSDDETPEEFAERETSHREYLAELNAELAATEEELRPYRPLINLGARLFGMAYRRTQTRERRRHLLAAF
jgi:hypothetical protein